MRDKWKTLSLLTSDSGALRRLLQNLSGLSLDLDLDLDRDLDGKDEN